MSSQILSISGVKNSRSGEYHSAPPRNTIQLNLEIQKISPEKSGLQQNCPHGALFEVGWLRVMSAGSLGLGKGPGGL
eukprot:641917-Pelagomonas_calceolata.AAC.1